MVEGKGTKDFGVIKRMMLDAPSILTDLLEVLTRAIRLYLEAQIAAGVQAIQIFDTWGGILDPDHYRKFSLDPMFEVIATMDRGGVPVIVFSKGANHALRDLAEIGADVVGLDWTIDMAVARETVGNRVALQGNLDPSFLYGTPESIRREVLAILNKFGKGSGHVFNLGHGIYPDVPVDHARALVRAVQNESPRFHD
jgi:uroporphyrinogen decarboxylase